MTMQEIPELTTALKSSETFHFQDYFRYGIALWKKHSWVITSYVAIWVAAIFLKSWFLSAGYFITLQESFGESYFSYLNSIIDTIGLSVFIGSLYFRLIELVTYRKTIDWVGDFFATGEDTLRFVYIGMANFGVVFILTNCRMITPPTPFDIYIAFAIFVNMSIALLVFLWSLFTLFALPIVIIYDVSWIEALKSSYSIVKQRFWYFLGFMVVLMCFCRFDMLMNYVIVFNGTQEIYDIYLKLQPFCQVFTYSISICIAFIAFQHLVLKREPNNVGNEQEFEQELVSKIAEIGQNEED